MRKKEIRIHMEERQGEEKDEERKYDIHEKAR